MAKSIALSLADPEVRSELNGALATSRFPEQKIWLQHHLARPSAGLRLREAMARATGVSPEAQLAEVRGFMDVELYFPFQAHRAAWSGGDDIQVAAVLDDDDWPVAFDIAGNRSVLDPERAPDLPTLVLTGAEVDFRRQLAGGPSFAECNPDENGDCGGGGGGGGGGSTPGLYMTKAITDEDYEGAFKGAPEFEVLIMGQKGSTDSLEVLQCAGEAAGGPYAFNMDDTTWTGDVLLASQTQLDAYKSQHPGQAFRVMSLEDDDTHCVPKMDAAEIEAILEEIETAYDTLTGARDSVTTLATYLNDASILFKILKAAYGWIATKDEFVGNAVEDDVAAEYLPGANWILKGDNTATHGGLLLEMR